MEILRAFTRYSASAPDFPVNYAPLFTGSRDGVMRGGARHHGLCCEANQLDANIESTGPPLRGSWHP
jgi:hypothetical protein